MTNAETLYRRGTALLESDPRQAIDFLTQSLELSPNVPSALYNRAVAYAQIGRDAEALLDVATLEQIAPDIGRRLRAEFQMSAEPYTDIAREQCRAGNFREAIVKCDSALAYQPRFADAWVVKGVALAKLGRPEDALQCYNKALEVEPNNYFAYINRAEVRHEQEQLEEAMTDFSKAIELRPESAEPYSGRSAVYAELKMLIEAAADAATAIRHGGSSTPENKGDR